MHRAHYRHAIASPDRISPVKSIACPIAFYRTFCGVGGLRLDRAWPGSTSAKPVLYPNATLSRVSDAQAQLEVNGCMARASQAGLRPSQNANEVGRRAGEGAASAGVASAVAALITGRSSDVLRAGATGVAVGGRFSQRQGQPGLPPVCSALPKRKRL